MLRKLTLAILIGFSVASTSSANILNRAARNTHRVVGAAGLIGGAATIWNSVAAYKAVNKQIDEMTGIDGFCDTGWTMTDGTLIGLPQALYNAYRQDGKERGRRYAVLAKRMNVSFAAIENAAELVATTRMAATKGILKGMCGVFVGPVMALAEFGFDAQRSAKISIGVSAGALAFFWLFYQGITLAFKMPVPAGFWVE